MGPYTDDVPKAFLNLGGRTLYDHQRAALSGYVDDVTVVLGYEADSVRDRVGDANVVVIEDWRSFENAESLRRAIRGVDDDVLVLNGDVVVTDTVVGTLVDSHDQLGPGQSVVGCIPGMQTESTALRSDEQGLVSDYGLIRGHRHAGVGIVDHEHLDAAATVLGRHRRDWYPVVYTAVETRLVTVPRSQHVEINRPQDLVAARGKLPFALVEGRNLQT